MINYRKRLIDRGWTPPSETRKRPPAPEQAREAWERMTQQQRAEFLVEVNGWERPTKAQRPKDAP